MAWVQFVLQHDRIPRLHNPVLFNDRLLRLKLDGSLQDPLRQFVTDKEYAKHYIASVVGREYTLETYDILRRTEAVDHLQLQCVPCVVKPTHMSGPVLICVNRDTVIDRDILKRWMNKNYYRQSREANYRFLRPKIIIEEFFTENGESPPLDYKIFCFHGHPMLIEVDAGRFRNHTRNFYDTEWNRLQITVRYPATTNNDPKPTNLDLMLAVAAEISKPFSSIRVDMYAINRIVKVGELTNCHESAGGIVRPRAAESWLGELFERRVADRGGRLHAGLYGQKRD